MRIRGRNPLTVLSRVSISKGSSQYYLMVESAYTVIAMACKIMEYYKKGKEHRRLYSGTSILERVRTEHILRRFISKPPLVIADIGGGTGPYAFMLAKMGYSVHLIDLTLVHTEKAKFIEKTSGHQLARISVGDARFIGLNDQSIDVVLFLGPLYHITAREDRIKALREAYRVLKPKGLIFAAGISRFTSFIDGIRGGYINDPDFVSIINQDLKNGAHMNPENKPFYFTTAFFHHPNELKQELEDSGFIFKSELAIEGPAWITKDFDTYWKVTKLRKKILSFIETIESDSTLIGASAHIMAIGKKE
ncbi:MAG: class I SAM-dependent methyltransferase [Candidatus Bathyarchaeia archaeon]